MVSVAIFAKNIFPMEDTQMKKNFKKIISFFMLLAMIITINPIPTVPDNDNEPGIEVCNDDDDVPTEAIGTR